MSRFYRSDSAERNWRTNVAFWLAGKEIWAWKSRSNRVVAKMSEAYTTNRNVKLLEELFDKAENAETRRLLAMGIALIKGENK